MAEETSRTNRPADGPAAAELRERIRAAGLDVGFARVGFADGPPAEASERLREWLERGYHGTMQWMARAPEARTDPERILPGLRSAVCVALRYGRPEPVPAVPGAPRISRYAWGRDYHEVMETKLIGLELRIRQLAQQARDAGGAISELLPPEIRLRRACDTSPVMDKAWAEAAGLGWLGRNTCLIHPREGSWLFLGEIFTNLPLPPDSPVADRCGRCRLCLDACPTGALVAPYQLDARRCISYLTIEHRADFTAAEGEAVGDWLVGCDICQDVCPWNRRAPHTEEAAFAPDPALVGRTPAVWEELDDAAYRAAVRGTSVARVKPAMMRRNARAVADNLSRGAVDRPSGRRLPSAEAPPTDEARFGE